MAFFNRLMYFGLTILIGALVIYVLSAIGILKIVVSLIASLLPVAIAIAVAIMLERPIQFLIKRKIKRVFAVIIIYSSLALIIISLIIFLVPIMMTQATTFLAQLPSLLHQIENFLYQFSDGAINIDLGVTLKNIAANFYQDAFNYIASFLSVFYTITIAITGAIFLSLDFPIFKKQVKKMIPQNARPIIYPFFHDFLPVSDKYVSAVLLNSTLLFIYTSIVFFIFGVPFPLIFALIVALTKLIPVIGAYLGAIPVVVTGLALSLNQGLVFLIIITAIQFIESNFIAPIIVRGRMKIKAIENLIAIAILGQIIGFLGMIIAPIVVSAIKIALYQRQLRKNNLDPTLVNPGAVNQIEEKKEKRLA